MFYFSFFFYIIVISAQIRAQLYFSPDVPYCVGDTVTLTCILQPSSGQFASLLADFRFNNSGQCYSRDEINMNNTGNINSTRYTHLSHLTNASLTNASGILEINPFLVIDAVTLFSCCVTTSSSTVISNSTSPRLAAPPSSASINISTTYNSATSCTGTITLTWLAVTSVRNVTSYEVLLNGTNITTLSPTAGTNTYTTSNMPLATFNGTYTVRAVSCAGSSVSNEVVFTPAIGAPFTPLNATPPYILNLKSSSTCTADVEYTLQQPSENSQVILYHLSINNTVIQTIPANTSNMYSFYYDITFNTTENITIISENCVGNSSQLALILPTIQGVNSVSITNPVITLNAELSFGLKFATNYTFEVNFTVYATVNYKDGYSESRAVLTSAQNSSKLYTHTIHLLYLNSNNSFAIACDVKNVSILVIVNSQCRQNLTLSSDLVSVEIISSLPATTMPISTTTTATATTMATAISSTISSSQAVSSQPLTCPSSTTIVSDNICSTLCNSTTTPTTTTPTTTTNTTAATNALQSVANALLGVSISIIILLLLLVIIIILLIIYVIYLSRKIKNLTSAKSKTENIIYEMNSSIKVYDDIEKVEQQTYYSTPTYVENNPRATATHKNDDQQTGYYNIHEVKIK